MKKNLDTNLGNLINPTPTAPAKEQDTAQAPATIRAKGNTKPVCYSVPPETAEKIRQIAAWDRKTINAVATEALEAYAAAWKPLPQEPPKF